MIIMEHITGLHSQDIDIDSLPNSTKCYHTLEDIQFSEFISGNYLRMVSDSMISIKL